MLKSDGDISKDGGLKKGGISRVHCSYIFTCKREITTLEYAKDNHNNVFAASIPTHHIY
jgi:hypothetical protein